MKIGNRCLALLLALMLLLTMTACEDQAQKAERPEETSAEEPAAEEPAAEEPAAEEPAAEEPAGEEPAGEEPAGEEPAAEEPAAAEPAAEEPAAEEPAGEEPAAEEPAAEEPAGEEPEPEALTFPEPGCAIEFPSRPRYHYDMDLTLNEADNSVSGHVDFRFYNDSEDDWDRLCLRDYPSLFIDPEVVGYDIATETNAALTEISGITDGRDGSALSYEREDDVSVLWIALPEPLAPDEEMTLSYDFKATVPTVADRFGVEAGVYNVTNFYPILAEYTDEGWSHAAFYSMGECFYSEVSDYEVRLTVPAGYTVASTGTETELTDNGETLSYRFDAPCVRDFVFSASGSFVTEERELDGVRVNVLYNRASQPVEDMAPAVEASFRAAEDSLAAFGEAFGRYPYGELDIILAPIAAGGMEYPNLVIISDQYCETWDLGGYIADYDPYGQLKVVIAHEIGHQWFMGIVGSNSGMQPWQDESLASYTELVYAEYLGEDQGQMYGRDVMDLTDPLVAKELTVWGVLPINRAYYEFSDPDSYVLSVYSIGQIVLYQMEEIVGQEGFHAVLRAYVHENAFTNANPASFFELLYAYAGTDNAALNELIDTAFDF